MDTHIYTRNGHLTRYALICGYAEIYGDWLNDAGVRLYQEGCIHVRGSKNGKGIWRVFDSLDEARSFARSISRYVPATDAFDGI